MSNDVIAYIQEDSSWFKVYYIDHFIIQSKNKL